MGIYIERERKRERERVINNMNIEPNFLKGQLRQIFYLGFLKWIYSIRGPDFEKKSRASVALNG